MAEARDVLRIFECVQQRAGTYDEDRPPCKTACETCQDLADQRIAALSAEGLIVVPVEPTGAMLRHVNGALRTRWANTWRAMITASTPPRAEKEKE